MFLEGSFVPRKPSLPRNGSFENYPVLVAPTTTAGRYIDGTAAGSTTDQSYGARAILSGAITASADAAFDDSVRYEGNVSLRLRTLDATGAITVGNVLNGSSPLSSEVFPMLPSTAYTITALVKTDNVATNGAFIDLRQFNSSLSTVTTNSSNKLSGTNDWTTVTITFTSSATTAYGAIFCRNNVAGNVSTAWFDLIRKRP